MNVKKCDRCGTLTEDPSGWYCLSFNITESDRLYTPVDKWREPRTYKWAKYDICPKCRKALGIAKIEHKADVGEQLLNLLSEIAREATEK